MRLHHLQIRAFGPFGGTETIDFDTLGAHGLFLMHGPTGSGKTTVLDAICFAVFAAVPGARRSQTERLISDHAPPGSSPQVRLEFTIAGRRLRITRSPKHLVTKKRGHGHTPRPAKVLLEERLDGGWSALSARVDETAHLLDELLGLGLEQFVQVVLLPQGEFAAFLRAKADDRAALLQRLFDISRFSDLETWLAERRRTVREALTVNDRAIRTAVVRAEESLVDLAPEIERWRSLPLAELPVRIDEARRHTSSRLSEAMVSADRTAADAEAAVQAHQQATTLHRLQQQGRVAGAAWAEWERNADARADVERRLEAHQRAGRVIAWMRTCERAETRDRDAAARATTLREELAAVGITDPDSVQVALTAGEQPLGRAVEADRVVRRARAELPGKATALGSAKAALAALETQRRQLDERSGVLEATVRSAREVLADLADLTRREALFAGWEKACSQARANGKLLDTAAVEWQRTAQLYAAAENRVIELRSRRLAGFAGELALDLQPGAPCPVCGSSEHPRPASAADAITAEMVAAAEEAAATAREDHERAQRRHITASTTVDTLRARAADLAAQWLDLTGEPLDDAVAPSVRSRLATERSAADRANRSVTDVEQELTGLAAQLRTVEDAHREAERHSARAAAEQDALMDQVRDATAIRDAAMDEHARVCPCLDGQRAASAASGNGPEPAVDDIRDHHRQLDDLVQRWNSGEQDARSAAQDHAAAKADLNRQLDAEGFADRRDVRTALLAPTGEESLRAQLREANDAAQRARGVLDQPEVQAALVAPPADPELADRARREAAAADKQAQADFVAARRAVASLDRLNDEVAELLANSAPERELLPTLDRLADLVSGTGDNSLRMRLSAYVLAARLEEVTTLANHQLEVMSAGRYRLEHTDAKAKGGARSGLGLQVRDSWTGTARDTATLSGGETFMVSLALALALGQAVLHDCGGRPLQTLLVDEGFGTLDEESLELVMQVLDELRSGGRTVGIVSHVGELRNRVPAQIRVHKTEQGSRVEVYVGDASSAA